MSEMIRPVYFSDGGEKAKINSEGLNKDKVIEKSKDGGINLDFSKITKTEINIAKPKSDEPKTPKTRRSSTVINPNDIVKAKSKKDDEESYEEKFALNNNMLRGTIAQIDEGLMELSEDVAYIRNSKNLRGKYNYLSLLQGTRGSFLSNKISAIRELNSSIAKSCDLDLKRAKDLKMMNAADKDDKKALMDMYQAFVSAPVGTTSGYSLGPSTLDMTGAGNNINGTIISSVNPDDMYNTYKQNMTPQQHMMSLENNPNIKQVVVWNKTNGAKSFEIMDMTSGEILKNVDKYDIMFMEDTVIDEKNGIARNVNLNESYPLIVVGQSAIDEY